MTLWARTAWALGFSVLAIGFVCVLLFVGQTLVGVPLLPDGLPQIPNAWLDASALRMPFPMRNWMPRTLPPGLLAALVGLAVMLLGAAVARRQAALLEAAKRDAEDRLRRVREYAGDGDGRIEPYIGSGVTFIDLEPDNRVDLLTQEESFAPDSAEWRGARRFGNATKRA